MDLALALLPDLANISGVKATIRYPVRPIYISGLDNSLMIVNNGINANLSNTGETTANTPVPEKTAKIDANVSANDVTRVSAKI
jgi:hypothetical protein